MHFNDKQVENVSCITNMNVYQSVNSSYAAPSFEECPTDEKVQQNGADYDIDVKVGNWELEMVINDCNFPIHDVFVSKFLELQNC